MTFASWPYDSVLAYRNRCEERQGMFCTKQKKKQIYCSLEWLHLLRKVSVKDGKNVRGLQ